MSCQKERRTETTDLCIVSREKTDPIRTNKIPDLPEAAIQQGVEADRRLVQRQRLEQYRGDKI